MYVQNALSVNEFLGKKWKARIPAKESKIFNLLNIKLDFSMKFEREDPNAGV